MLETMKNTMVTKVVTKMNTATTNQMKPTLSTNRLPSLKADHHEILLMMAL
jgi:hypothetical protein